MPSAFALRTQIEVALAGRIPSALTPQPAILRAVTPTGIGAIDELLQGGLPLGAITEVVGAECSGRTGLALSFIAQITKAAKVCAWIDVSDTLHPESAAAAGVDLPRLLWVRCGVSSTSPQHSMQSSFALPDKYLIPPPIKRGLHGGGFGPHPRNEVKGLSDAVSGLLRPETIAPRCAEPQRRVLQEREVFEPHRLLLPKKIGRQTSSGKPWSRLDQALRVADLLLQAGGFSAIVLDMGSIAPDYASRVPLSTWFRYRAAAERTHASILLLTQHPCSKSSAALVLRLQPGDALQDEVTVFTGIEHRVEVVRQRFAQGPANVVSLRKPPQRENAASWQSRTTWAGQR
ncbi:MAG: recombinase RecA [Acidobacteriaceae bacterium]